MNELHIPTVGGQNQVIGFDVKTGLNTIKYKALLSNVESNAPNVVKSDSDTELENIVWSHGGQNGVYVGTLFGAFANNTYLSSQLVFSQTDTEITAYTNMSNDDDTVTLVCFDKDFNAVNNQDVFVEIEVSKNISDSEDIFNDILSSLDAVQTEIWTKIIVRDSGTVTEVDGAKYRRTLDFNASSKLINS